MLDYVLEESDYVYRQKRESDYVRVGLCVRGSGCNPGWNLELCSNGHAGLARYFSEMVIEVVEKR